MNTLLATFFTAHSWLLAQATDTTTTTTAGHSGAGAVGNGWLYSIVIGLVIGVVAKFLTPGRDPGGCIITSLIGIGGSVVAYFLGSLLGFYHSGDTPGFIASVIGAIILLVLYHAVIGRKNV